MTTAPPPETTTATTLPQTSAALSVALDEHEMEPVDTPEYSSLRANPADGYGWSPSVFAKQVPNGVPDFVNNSQSLINFDEMNFYIGMTDLLDPKGYRHIDNSGAIHPSSVIKLWIGEYAMLQIQAGNGSLNDVLVGGTLRYHIQEMMQMSCNTSTAIVISYFGRTNIDNWLVENYYDTRLHSDLRGNYSQGRTNCTSVRDTVRILEKIFQNRHTDAYGTLFNMMVNTRTRAKLPTALAHHPEVVVASKTGSFIYYNAADHDVGIVVGHDVNGNINVAFTLVIYTYSRPFQPTFSVARTTLYHVTQNLYLQAKNHVIHMNNQAIMATSTPETTTTPHPTTTTVTTTTTTTPPPTTTTTVTTTTTAPPTTTTVPTTTTTEPPATTTVPTTATFTEPPVVE
jgi:hypothetical protein